MKTIYVLLLVLAASFAVSAQPRSLEVTAKKDVKPAPASFPARYEGGILGYNDRESGSLKFDDVNERIVFFGSDQKERFGIPYASLLIVGPSEKSVTSTAGNVVKHIPLPGAGLAGLIKEKRHYLLLQYDDPDVDAKGTTSFKIEDKDLIESVIHTLGQKAKMKQRGDAYIRPRPVPKTPEI